ncbi:helix-turn-helix domain-containing protein [Flavobacterium sp.]|uniref:helix-turn-helix domain-containing protein n=1 Tax=Flavobacterium sp. TaxID=239 RepID=UPI003D0FAF41
MRKKTNRRNELRETLGVSQLELAQLLSIHPGVIAMYEIGQRDLPTMAMLELSRWYNYVFKKLQESNTFPDQLVLKDEIKAFLEKEIQKKELQLHKSTSKLTSLEHKYKKALANLQLATYFDNEGKQQNSDEQQTARWLRLLAKDKIKISGPLQQLKYQLQIENLQNELIRLQELLSSYL